MKTTSNEGTADCKCLKLAIDDGAQTVLYCTVLYCTVVNYPVFMSHHNYFLGKAHLKNNTHIWASVPTGGGGLNESQPP